MRNFQGLMLNKIMPMALIAGLASLLLSFGAQAAEASLFTRLGGTYNLAQTVDHLVDSRKLRRHTCDEPTTRPRLRR